MSIFNRWVWEKCGLDKTITEKLDPKEEDSCYLDNEFNINTEKQIETNKPPPSCDCTVININHGPLLHLNN